MRHNLFSTDCKEESAKMLARGLREVGCNVMCISPDNTYAHSGCADMNANLLEPLIEAIWSDDHRIRQLTTPIASNIAKIGIPLPESNGGAERFFRGTSQTAACAIMIFHAVTERDGATLGRFYRTAADPDLAYETLERARDFRLGDDSNPIITDMRRMAGSVLSLASAKPEYWSQFLSPAQEGFRVFDDTGPYGRMGEYTNARISDLRRLPNQALFLMIPLRRLDNDGVVVSLTTSAVFTSAVIYPTGQPIHCELDEFNRMNIPGFDTIQNTLRGLNVSAAIYVQSKAGIEKNYGEVATRQILDNCDIVQWNAFDTLGEAEECSRILGEEAGKEYDANIDGPDFETVRFGVKDTSIPLRSPQQLLAMPKDEAIVRVRGMKPIRAKKLPYWDVAGLRKLIDENPLEGKPPRTRPKAKLDISRKGVRVVWPKPPRRKDEAKKSSKRSPLTALSAFAFIYAWLGIHTVFWLNGIDVALLIRRFVYA
ncbi:MULTISPECIES: TraM recognition domain-containing protein [Alphaproteobacteria]|uniref:type IV secretory system conjugative DNA transfer family protein n=1 Tax=Alphaproteobacteria TaxID=28211 RepID=UPI00329A7395